MMAFRHGVYCMKTLTLRPVDRISIHIGMYVYIHIDIYIYVYSCWYAYVYVYLPAYIHTYIHIKPKFIHKHIYIYVYVYACLHDFRAMTSATAPRMLLQRAVDAVLAAASGDLPCLARTIRSTPLPGYVW